MDGMSRGPGRVMREALAVVERYGRASTGDVTAAVFPLGGEAGAVSTRRALRRLERRGVLAALGWNLRGERVYSLAAEAERLACPWSAGEGAAVLLGMAGQRGAAFTVRLYYSSRFRLTPEQVTARTRAA